MRPELSQTHAVVLRLCYEAAIANGSGCVALHSAEVRPAACGAGIDDAALLASCLALERAGYLLVFLLPGGDFHAITTGAGFGRYAREHITGIGAIIAAVMRLVADGSGDNARIAAALGQPEWLIVAIRRSRLRA